MKLSERLSSSVVSNDWFMLTAAHTNMLTNRRTDMEAHRFFPTETHAGMDAHTDTSSNMQI